MQYQFYLKYEKNINWRLVIFKSYLVWLGLWRLMPLPTICQLYRGGQCYWCKGGPGENHRPAADKFHHIMLYRVHLAMIGARTQNVIGDRHWLQQYLKKKQGTKIYPRYLDSSTLSHTAITSTLRLIGIRTHNAGGDMHW